MYHYANGFTFHYVSIKSGSVATPFSVIADLHSTMYLLNLDHVTIDPLLNAYLHSTMYLLNLAELCPRTYRIPIYIPLCIY